MLYHDENGAKVFVSPGISTDGHTWLTVRQIGNKGKHRIKTKLLPIRETKAEAEADLRVYAEQKGWRKEAETESTTPEAGPDFSFPEELRGKGRAYAEAVGLIPQEGASVPMEIAPDRIKKANTLHKKFISVMRKGAMLAFEIGEALNEIWGELDAEASWPDWCQKHLVFDVSTANRYLRIYENFKDDPRALKDQTIGGALKLLSAPRREALKADVSGEADRQQELPWERYFELPPLDREVKLKDHRFEIPNSHEVYLIRRGFSYPVKIAEVLAPEDERLKTARRGMFENVQAALERYYQEVERIETLEVIK
jgi:hypothetical protein